ncbi:MAG TPA: sodium:solute symporter family protein [Verrucomicrobia bacterium]|nr:sodium:solute symporter family protein [Verrucomicrobiota bacterium]
MPSDVNLLDIVLVLLYVFATAFLGYLGYRGTRTATDYLVAGRKAHPFVMSLSYGATFISTSAIVGFGGVAGMFGLSLLWLTFCNIFIGVFIAFIFLGEPTRRLGHRLDAHTFPELLGRRFESRFVQVFAGLIIALLVPLYGAAVLIGGTEFLSTALGMPYNTALLVLAVLVAAYVFFGGLKGVMYTDALQGVVMFVGMAILVIFTYSSTGGISEGHRQLGELKDLAPASLTSIGHRGWTAMPEFGFGDTRYNLWWIIVSTVVMGVGIGVLAQPQLAVRFMTVRSKRELNRAVGIGGVFILAVIGVAYVTGALSNVFFTTHGPPFQGRIIQTVDADKGHVLLQVMKQDQDGAWMDVVKETNRDGKALPDTTQPVRLDDQGKWLPVMKGTNANGTVREGVIIPAVLDRDNPFVFTEATGNRVAQGRSLSIVYAKGASDQIMPTYISMAMPKWFELVFLLTLLSAAMSTLSSQFHTLGTAAGRDLFESFSGFGSGQRSRRTIYIVRSAIFVGLIVAVALGYYARKEQAFVSFIMRATAIFFGVCAATFLPAFIGGICTRAMTRAAAIASMIAGFLVSAAWLLLVKVPECTVIGLVQDSLLAHKPNWPVVDPLFIALPVSTLTAVLVSAFTRKSSRAHLERCFGTPPHAAPRREPIPELVQP